MKIFRTLILFLSILPIATNAQKIANKANIKALNQYLTGMVAIRGDEYAPRTESYEMIAGKSDSLIIMSYLTERVKVGDFMISDHEVTNSEYKLFLRWVKDSIASKTGNRNIKSQELTYKFRNQYGQLQEIAVYPDTARWETEFPHSFNSLLLNYFYHPAYCNYPVVGLSYHQVNAYIHWLNVRLRKFLASNNFDENLCSYKLPSEAEWQYAALKPTKIGDRERSIYPWAESLFDNKGKYKANFGMVMDKNNIGFKGYCTDGYCHTSPVKSYAPNHFGLYDMGGNVAEWVADTFSVTNHKRRVRKLLEWSIADKMISVKIDSLTRQQVIDNLMTFAPDWNKIEGIVTDRFSLNRLKKDYATAEHDFKAINRTAHPGIVKGGSWYDPPVYLISCITSLYPQAGKSSRVGFRVAMDMKEEIWIFLNTK
jgi:formylglycine-generating enzyme required for sulfatase activity